MRRPKTLQAFTNVEKASIHLLLATRVATMMARKLEEDDWADIYCRAKEIPKSGWSNLGIDVAYQGLGVEHKMLRPPSDVPLLQLCGTRLMHPSATRSIRIPTSQDPNEVMRDVLTQYAALIMQRYEQVRQAYPNAKPDMRMGWLLWQSSLREFLYFEEEMLPPDPTNYYAEWRSSSGGRRKASTNLWVYEATTGYKRYSITTSAGPKIQPYFDVPPPNDPNLYFFKVQGEQIEDGRIRIWLTASTARELRQLVGDLTTENIGLVIADAANEATNEDSTAISSRQDAATPILLTSDTYTLLSTSFVGVSDEHSIQLLIRQLTKD